MSRKNLFNIDNLSAQDIDENSELIPLMTPEDELEISKEELPQTLPILSLRNTVLFPGVVIPITASRDKSIRLIKDANNFNKLIGVVAQKDESVEDPKLKDIYNIGTVAKIIKVLQMPDGNTTVIIQGKKRFEIERVISETPYITSNIKDNPEENPGKENSEFNAIIDSIKDLSLEIIKRNPNIPSEASFAIWYRQIRIGVMAKDPETRKLYEAGLRMLSLNYSERVKQLKHYFGLIEQSIILIEKEKGKTKEFENQQFILSCWTKLEEVLEKNKNLELPAPEKLLSELRESLKTSVSSYTERIRNLSPESVNLGIKWMENLREEGGRNLSQTLTPNN